MRARARPADHRAHRETLIVTLGGFKVLGCGAFGIGCMLPLLLFMMHTTLIALFASFALAESRTILQYPNLVTIPDKEMEQAGRPGKMFAFAGVV